MAKEVIKMWLHDADGNPIAPATTTGQIQGEDGTPLKELLNDEKVGKLEDLKTDSRTTAVAAINEIYDDLAKEVKRATEADAKIPTKVSDLSNDSGYLSQETDPTVPAWAKAPSKPSYSASEVGALPDTTFIPAATEDLTNNSGFITKAVDDLTNYYKTSETYTKDEVDALIDAIPKFNIQVVDNLPITGAAATIYLLKGATVDEGNLYSEFIYVDDEWELLGTQKLDLSGYALKSELSAVATSGSFADLNNKPNWINLISYDEATNTVTFS